MRAMMSKLLLSAVAAVAVAVPTASGESTDDGLLVNLILNSDFEAVADSECEPPKFGAYWKNAFDPHEGTTFDRVESREDGNRVLALRAGDPPVSQILTLLGPHSGESRLELRAKLDGADSVLIVRLRSQSERVIEWRIGGTEDPLAALSADADGMSRYAIALGREFEKEFGSKLPPWGRLELEILRGESIVDDVVVAHRLPDVAHRELRAMLLDDVRDALRVHLEPQVLAPDGARVGKGLGIVDATSGYQVVSSFDVETGAILGAERVAGIRGIHEVLLRWLRSRDDAAEHENLRERGRSILRNHVLSLLKNNVYVPTGLFTLYDLGNKRQVLEAELSPSHFIEYVLDAADVLAGDKVVRNYAEFHAEKMADAMVKLRREHDLPPGIPFGRGPGGNWFGRMPEKVSALGVLAKPMKSTYDQAWAISQNRSWYHDFDTAVGLMRVHALRPKPEYVEAVKIACAKFDRQFDARRYDLENDTDDHYGKNVESALLAERHAPGAVPELIAFAQAATDHRLPRDVPWTESLWVQGIRLGQFTTGDQPRAYRGPIGLYHVPPERNPETSGYEPYVEALRELCRADLRRRILDDGYATEASSYLWEMKALCFKGDYIAPCDEGLDWEGDMGDLFAGPPVNAFRALLRTIEIDRAGPDRALIAWYAALHGLTLEKYRAPYGYRFGMDPATGQRYGLRDSDPIPFTTTHAYGLAVTLMHVELLETLRLEADAARVAIESVTFDEQGAATVALEGPAGRRAVVFAAAEGRLEEIAITDARLRHVARRHAPIEGRVVFFDEEGEATLVIAGAALGERGTLALDVELPRDDGRGIEDVRGGIYRR
jgi:hypothetical protein